MRVKTSVQKKKKKVGQISGNEYKEWGRSDGWTDRHTIPAGNKMDGWLLVDFGGCADVCMPFTSRLPIYHSVRRHKFTPPPAQFSIRRTTMTMTYAKSAEQAKQSIFHFHSIAPIKATKPVTACCCCCQFFHKTVSHIGNSFLAILSGSFAYLCIKHFPFFLLTLI